MLTSCSQKIFFRAEKRKKPKNAIFLFRCFEKWRNLQNFVSRCEKHF